MAHGTVCPLNDPAGAAQPWGVLAAVGLHPVYPCLITSFAPLLPQNYPEEGRKVLGFLTGRIIWALQVRRAGEEGCQALDCGRAAELRCARALFCLPRLSCLPGHAEATVACLL